MNEAYLLTGGNMGNVKQTLEKANELISKNIGTIVCRSSLYRTAAWGITSQDDFLNQVLKVETTLEAPELMERILDVEHQLGRQRTEKYGPRTIDIDILFYNDAVIDIDNLEIPHPRMQYRKFVLEPLNEIAPGMVHPVLKKTVQELLTECEDRLEVKRLVDEV